MSAPVEEREEPPSAGSESSLDYDALSFTDVRYWDHFYHDEDLSFYEWYSAEDWLHVAVDDVGARVSEALGGAPLRVLDVGVGTSPCLFALAALRPERYAALHGVDFSPAAVAFLQSQAQATDAHPGLRFWTADARELAGVEDASVDVVLDKGCLDCFITGDSGVNDVGEYLRALQRVIAGPHARVLLLAVNAADVPRLLATGETVPDPHAGGGGRSGIAWGARKAETRAESAWTQTLWVEGVVAFAEKHLLICAPVPPGEGAAPPTLRCHECGRTHAWSAGGGVTRAACPCGNRLKRFALS